MTHVEDYEDRDLRTQPHIEIQGGWKISNFVVKLQFLRLLKQENPSAKFDLQGKEATRSLGVALYAEERQLNWQISWDKPRKNNNLLGHLKTVKTKAKQQKVVTSTLNSVSEYIGFNPLKQKISRLQIPKWVGKKKLKTNRRSPLSWGIKPQQGLKDRKWKYNAYLEKYANTNMNKNITNLLWRLEHLNPSQEDMNQVNLTLADLTFITQTSLFHRREAQSSKIWTWNIWSRIQKWYSSKSIKVRLMSHTSNHKKCYHKTGDEKEQLIKRYQTTLTNFGVKTNLIYFEDDWKQKSLLARVDATQIHVQGTFGTTTKSVMVSDKNDIATRTFRLWQKKITKTQRTVGGTIYTDCYDIRDRKSGGIDEEQLSTKGVDTDQVIHCWKGK